MRGMQTSRPASLDSEAGRFCSCNHYINCMTHEGTHMEEKNKLAAPKIADIAKAASLAFLFGGAFSAIGQLFVILWTPILGANHPLLGFAVLATMGVLGMVLFVTGLHQKLAPIAGFGLVFPFNGFCAAVSEAYVNGRKKTGTVGGGFRSAVGMVGYVIGFGAICVLIIAAAVNAFEGVM